MSNSSSFQPRATLQISGEHFQSICMLVLLSRGAEICSGVQTSVVWTDLTVWLQPPWSLSALTCLLSCHHVLCKPLSSEGFASALAFCSDYTMVCLSGGFPHSSDGKESACSAGDPGLIHGLGRSPGEGNGKPLQYSCLENPTDGGAWWAPVHGVGKSRARLSD